VGCHVFPHCSSADARMGGSSRFLHSDAAIAAWHARAGIACNRN
jgi:hypothetical protein